jgi:hypothetical protein
VEFQHALAGDPAAVALDTSAGEFAPAEYLEWGAPYLFYFSVPLAHRFEVAPLTTDRLMLVPLGAAPPTVVERRFPLAGVVPTHSLGDFYAAPR